jgi:hypothetical protein
VTHLLVPLAENTSDRSYRAIIQLTRKLSPNFYIPVLDQSYFLPCRTRLVLGMLARPINDRLPRTANRLSRLSGLYRANLGTLALCCSNAKQIRQSHSSRSAQAKTPVEQIRQPIIVREIVSMHALNWSLTRRLKVDHRDLNRPSGFRFRRITTFVQIQCNCSQKPIDSRAGEPIHLGCVQIFRKSEIACHWTL